VPNGPENDVDIMPGERGKGIKKVVRVLITTSIMARNCKLN
jgi:hypothetical protein